MNGESLKELTNLSCRARMGILTATHSAKSGHPGGSLSAVDMITYLYFRELKVDPARPDWEERDRFVLSKGHSAPALYAVLALKGFFPEEELKTLRAPGSRLQGHPDMHKTPGVDFSTGSLGQGISAAVGMALAAKRSRKNLRVYALLGDGEIQEGEVWEAMMFAHHYQLDNLCIIIDNNNLQIDGALDEVMSPYPIIDKLEAFGCRPFMINGHSFQEIEEALDEARQTMDVPSVILMTTTKGKGVSFMENQVGWHGKAPNDAEYEQAMQELQAQLDEISRSVDQNGK